MDNKKDEIIDPKPINRQTDFASAYFNRTAIPAPQNINRTTKIINDEDKPQSTNDTNGNIPKSVETFNCYIVLVKFIYVQELEYENALGDEEDNYTKEDELMIEFNENLRYSSFLICKSEEELNIKLMDLLKYNDYVDVNESIIINNKRSISKSLGLSSSDMGVVSISKYLKGKSNETNSFNEILDSYIINQEESDSNHQISQDYTNDMKEMLNYMKRNNLNIDGNKSISNNECPYETFDDYLNSLKDF